MTTGEIIKSLRIKKGLSQEELGKMVGVQRAAINKYEKGLVVNLKRATIAKLASALDVTPTELMGWEDIEPVETADTVVPIRFLGSIAAGYGRLANEEYEYLRVPEEWLCGRPASDYFAMRVTGSSMYPMYCDGDEILCLACNDMGRSGRVGVIIYGDNEATLKKIEYEAGKDWVDLVPINPEYETRRIWGVDLEQCRVIGRAIRLIRNIEH